MIWVVHSWKQPQCPSREKWFNSSWHVPTIEYFAALKINELEPNIFTKEPHNVA